MSPSSRMKVRRVSPRIVLGAALMLGVFAAAAHLTAQEEAPVPKPGPEHALFKEWEGTWDAVINAGDAESRGTLTCEVGLNGLWLMDHFKGTIAETPFEGRGATSYDPAKKKYVNVWIDSMTTSPSISEGDYDKGSKTMTMAGSMPLPDGASMKTMQTTVTKDKDTRHFVLKGVTPDGQEIEMVQITYKRRAKKADSAK